MLSSEMEFDSPDLKRSTDEEEVRFENPINIELQEGNNSAVGEHMSTAQMVAANETEMTEGELADLSYAFQAADMDGGGAIDIGGTRVSTPHVLECGN